MSTLSSSHTLDIAPIQALAAAHGFISLYERIMTSLNYGSMVWNLRYVAFARRWGGGGVGIEDLRVCFGGGALSSCGLFGSFSGGLNDGCRRLFRRSFQCCVYSA